MGAMVRNMLTMTDIDNENRWKIGKLCPVGERVERILLRNSVRLYPDPYSKPSYVWHTEDGDVHHGAARPRAGVVAGADESRRRGRINIGVGCANQTVDTFDEMAMQVHMYVPFLMIICAKIDIQRFSENANIL